MGSREAAARATIQVAVAIELAAPAGAATGEAAKETTLPFELKSVAFEQGKEIPAAHTCEGEDASPPLAWSGVPEGCRSLALVMDDPDAPDPRAPKVTWVHWVLYNIAPSTSGFAGGVSARDLPPGAKEGLNDWKRVGYRGPCPPVGRHRYFLKLYALDAELPDLDRPTKADLERAMKGHVIAEAVLMGTYQKKIY